MMLEYRNITKKFGNKEAVKELTLNLKKGTIYGCLLYTSDAADD